MAGAVPVDQQRSVPAAPAPAAPPPPRPAANPPAAVRPPPKNPGRQLVDLLFSPASTASDRFAFGAFPPANRLAPAAAPEPTRACSTSECDRARADLHELIDGLKNERATHPAGSADMLNRLGLDPAVASRWIDAGERRLPDLQLQLKRWKDGIADLKRRDAEARPDLPPQGSPEPDVAPPTAAPPPPSPPAAAVPTEPTPAPSAPRPVVNRASIASPGMRERDTAGLRSDLRKLGYATGNESGWGTPSAEAYRDFVSNAVAAGRITPQQAASAAPADRAAIRDLMHTQAASNEPDADLRATPAQATFNGTVNLSAHVRPRDRNREQPPAEVEKIQRALIDRGFMPIDTGAAEIAAHRVGRVTEQAIRTFISAYRGFHQTSNAKPVLTGGSELARVLFGSSEGPGGVRPRDGVRWVHIQEGPGTGIAHPTYDEDAGRHKKGDPRPTSLWGTSRFADMVAGTLGELRRDNPNAELKLNDMSSRTGGRFAPHQGHQNGDAGDMDFDDVSEAKAILRALKAQGQPISLIGTTRQELLSYGRDLGLPMVPYANHNAHLHVEVAAYNGSEERAAGPLHHAKVRDSERPVRTRHAGHRYASRSYQAPALHASHRSYRHRH